MKLEGEGPWSLPDGSTDAALILCFGNKMEVKFEGGSYQHLQMAAVMLS